MLKFNLLKLQRCAELPIWPQTFISLIDMHVCVSQLKTGSEKIISTIEGILFYT